MLCPFRTHLPSTLLSKTYLKPFFLFPASFLLSYPASRIPVSCSASAPGSDSLFSTGFPMPPSLALSYGRSESGSNDFSCLGTVCCTYAPGCTHGSSGYWIPHFLFSISVCLLLPLLSRSFSITAVLCGTRNSFLSTPRFSFSFLLYTSPGLPDGPHNLSRSSSRSGRAYLPSPLSTDSLPCSAASQILLSHREYCLLKSVGCNGIHIWCTLQIILHTHKAVCTQIYWQVREFLMQLF